MPGVQLDRRVFLAAGSAFAGAAMTGTANAASDQPTKSAAATQSAASAGAFDGSASWIGRENPPVPAVIGKQSPAPMLRRGFTLPSAVSKAELKVAGYGYYEAHINGQRVSDAVLDPPPSQYDKTVFSRSIDVTELLTPGPNAIGVLLGRAYVSGISGPGATWTSEPRLLAQLDITFADGKSQRVVSDGSWKMADSPIHDWMYYGEEYDARKETPGWSLPTYDDSSWRAAPVQHPPTGSIVPAKAPPVAVVDTFSAASVATPAAGVTVYDFGKITAGWARIRVRGPAGAQIQLGYGQQLKPDGRVVLLPPWGLTGPMMHVDKYTLKGEGLEVWEPRFTRHGFQYVEVTVTGGPCKDFSIETRECHTPARSTGSFSCSNPLLNKMHANHRRSLLLNHWGFPTDTSWRDRQGWTADAAQYLDSAILNFAGLKDVYVDWLRSLRDAQRADGTVSIYAPDNYHFPLYNDPSWSGMLILIPWMLYQHFDDLGPLSDNYEAMTSWMDLMDSKITATGNLYDGPSPGDHSSPGSEAGGTLQLRPPEGTEITKNAHLFQEARTLAKIAGLLGNKAHVKRYDAMADRILAAFNRAYFDPGANVYKTPTQVGYRQTSNLMPLALDMVPETHREAVFANLVRDLVARGHRLNTGCIGTKLLLPVLTKHGRGDLAYAVATQTKYPSWGYWVTQGATSSWETWRIEGPEQTKDHPFLGTFDDWLYQHLVGIQSASPGYAALRFAPVFPAGLEHASAEVTIPRGVATSSWRRTKDVLSVSTSHPRGVTAELALPFGPDRVAVKTGKLRLVKSEGASAVYVIESEKLTVQVT